MLPVSAFDRFDFKMACKVVWRFSKMTESELKNLSVLNLKTCSKVISVPIKSFSEFVGGNLDCQLLSRSILDSCSPFGIFTAASLRLSCLFL